MITLLMLCLCVEGAKATPQEPEILLVEGKQFFTLNTPGIADAFPDVPLPEFVMISTANRRGFRGTWAIIDRRLYLIGIEGRTKESGSSLADSKALFPDLAFPAFAKDYTGSFSLGVRYDDYLATAREFRYTEKITLTFERGVLMKSAIKTRSEPRE